ncbi:MAG: GntR family transcriptional regulator [Fervidobacterium sp.]|jgi:GntR family transcriptional regulator
MWFNVDFHSHVPVYVQIKENIKNLILSGKLKSGDFVPSIRNLARDIGVNVNTVARAYRELEQEGIIRPERGEGYIVVQLDEEKLKNEMFEELKRVIRKLNSIGISKNDIYKIVEEEFRR